MRRMPIIDDTSDVTTPLEMEDVICFFSGVIPDLTEAQLSAMQAERRQLGRLLLTPGFYPALIGGCF